MRALLIEDETLMARSICVMLKATGIVVDHVESGEEGVELARRYDYDILILDVLLGDIQGYDVIRKLRTTKIHTPILVVSGLTRPQAKINCLALGADDFLCKPFDKLELVARINAITRRFRGFSSALLQIGRLEINMDKKEACVDGTLIRLTSKEYAILELMALRKGVVLNKEVFLNHLYGGIDEPEIKIIDVFICKIRKKLSEQGCSSLIQTIWGRGYMMRDESTHRAAEDPTDRRIRTTSPEPVSELA